VIGVVVQDAGSSNLILHKMRQAQIDFEIYAFGPALQIARELGLSRFLKSKINAKVTRILAGANYRDVHGLPETILLNYERLSVPIDGVLDGWEYFTERFPGIKIRNYIVMDEIAYGIASSLFPGKVKLERNFYYEYEIASFLSLREIDSVSYFRTACYLSQPKPNLTFPKSHHGRDCICADLEKVVKSPYRPSKVLVRDHVKMNSANCVSTCNSALDVSIELTSRKLPLHVCLASSEFVFGAPSTALYIAQKSGLQAIAVDQSASWQGPKFPHLE
jgi:hypothetical protein